MNHGAGQGIKIEENFYDIDGNLKRFFNEEQLRELFKNWNIKYINECEMNRYKDSKILWEISIGKRRNFDIYENSEFKRGEKTGFVAKPKC